MKTLRVDYGASENKLTVPAGIGLQLASVVRGDLYELQLLATKDGAPINFTTAGFTNYGLLIFKNRDQYLAGGNFTDAFIGFATGSSWWNPSQGQLAIQFALANDVPATVNYFAGVVIFNTTGDQWTLGTDPITVPLTMPLYEGTETNRPQGVPGGTRGIWQITGAVPYVDVPVPGATSNTNLLLSVRPSTGGAGSAGNVTQTPLVGGVDTVRLETESAPGIGAAYNGTWVLERL